MNKMTRRGLLTAGVAAGASAVFGVAKSAGAIPPDHAGFYGPGETLNYASHRLLGRHAMAREFSRDQISARPVPNEMAPPSEAYKKLEAAGFADWRLAVDGLVERPGSFSLDQLRTYAKRSHITQLACEEGWSYIAEWTGAPLSELLGTVGVKPEAKFVVYRSIEHGWWDSIDMDEAMHAQTLLAYELNGAALPTANGGPLRMRVPRQLGYKSVKFIVSLTLTDDLKKFGKGLGSASPEGGYAWYAGI